MTLKTEVMASFYQDSVVLMRVSAQVRREPGVREMALFMGTPANQALLEQAGLATPEGRQAGPNDLVLTVQADGDAQAAHALAAAREMLLASRKNREASSEYRPRSLESALRALPDANLVAISVAGPYVRAEAMAALKRQLHVFIFSDNVPVEDELALKQEAVRRGLLCMGPDQGTAYLGGAGIGFANLVSRGRIGCVAASGTGLQTVVSRLDALGEGVSHGIGVGGRDLSEAIGGLMTLHALDLLAGDAATEAIVLVSKPPHASVLPRLEAKLEAVRKPVVVCCVGAPARATGGRIAWVDTLDQAADAAVTLLEGRPWTAPTISDASLLRAVLAGASGGAEGQRILGLYTGGTLAYEAKHLLRQALGAEHGHEILDLGDDEYTVGRPHPMIDPAVRTAKIVEAGSDPGVGVLLVDLVLGNGAHEDPAQPLVEAVRKARHCAGREGRTLSVVASVLGTTRDRQGLVEQKAKLRDAGIGVLATNADAVRCAAMLARPALRAHWLPREA